MERIFVRYKQESVEDIVKGINDWLMASSIIKRIIRVIEMITKWKMKNTENKF